jgi:putative spermidine/putrescine transport system ATP-binding protein
VTHDQEEALSLADRIVVMKDGVVQQIGAPPDVYAQPANLHVARFMGYRNVLALDVAQRDGDRIVLSNPDFTLTGTQKQPVAGNRASVAIRPEEIVVVNGSGAANTISGRIDNVEYGGRDALLDVVTPSGTMLHVRGPVNVKRDDIVNVHVPPERVLVYPSE